MAYYLSLIRKQDFADLYRHGFFHVNKDLVLNVAKYPKTLKRKKERILKHFKSHANPLEDSRSYLFIHFCKEKKGASKCDIRIEDVLHLYPLDRDAQEILQEDFGSDIQFEDPLWEDAVQEIMIAQKVEDCRRGPENLWKIFGLDQSLYSECERLFSEDIITEVVREEFHNERPSGDLLPWVYLLRYERHSLYSHNTLGSYMDMVHAIINYKMRKEQFDIEGSEVYRFLETIPPDLTSKEIFNQVQGSPDAKNFLDYVSSITDGDYDLMTLGTTFFTLKYRYKEGIYEDSKFVKQCLSTWPKEFPMAVFLYGWILGHEHTSECLYKTQSLKILTSSDKEISPHQRKLISLE